MAGPAREQAVTNALRIEQRLVRRPNYLALGLGPWKIGVDRARGTVSRRVFLWRAIE